MCFEMGHSAGCLCDSGDSDNRLSCDSCGTKGSASILTRSQYVSLGFAHDGRLGIYVLCKECLSKAGGSCNRGIVEVKNKKS